jgi:hypothetical protein
MRKTLLAAALGLALGSPLSALSLDASVHGGFTTFNMGDLNRSNATLMGWDLAPYSQDISSGYVVGMDWVTRAWSPLAGMTWGLRTEYLQSNLAEMKNYPNDVTLVMTDQASLTDALVGANLAVPAGTSGLTVGVGAWLGYGLGVMNQHKTYDGGSSRSIRIQSGAFSDTILVGELETSLGYDLTPHWGVSFTGGWRWADAPEVKSGSEALDDGSTLWEFGRKTPVNVDFGGATAQGSVHYRF